jgi:predicted oxidoreductase
MEYSMKAMPLSPEGPLFSPLVQGYWRLTDWHMSPSALLDFIEAHMDLGITTVDHADIYGGYQCEARFGDALRLKPVLRENMQIVSKCDICLPVEGRYTVKQYDTRASHIRKSVENSLKNLGTDRLDLLLLHRPDPLMDADEVAGVFDALHSEGKVLHFGVSNFRPETLDLLNDRLSHPLVTNQVEISPLQTVSLTDGTLDHCQRLRLRPMAWSCLGGGALFGDQAASGSLQKSIRTVANELGASPDQVVFAWVLALPSRPLPIIGSGRIERVRAAVGALDLKLSRTQWFSIYEAALGSEVP